MEQSSFTSETEEGGFGTSRRWLEWERVSKEEYTGRYGILHLPFYYHVVRLAVRKQFILRVYRTTLYYLSLRRCLPL